MHAVGMALHGKLSLFMEAFGFEVEEELSTMATQTWAEGGVEWCKWHTEQKT